MKMADTNKEVSMSGTIAKWIFAVKKFIKNHKDNEVITRAIKTSKGRLLVIRHIAKNILKIDDNVATLIWTLVEGDDLYIWNKFIMDDIKKNVA